MENITQKIIQTIPVVEEYKFPKFLKWFYIINTLLVFIVLAGFYFFTGSVGIYTGMGYTDEWIYKIYVNFLFVDTFISFIIFVYSIFMSIKNKKLKLFLISFLFTIIQLLAFVLVFSNFTDGQVGSVPIPSAPIPTN